MNRKGKIFVGTVLAVIAIVIGIVFVIRKQNKDMLDIEIPVSEQINTQYVRTSTKSWADRAWLGKMEPEKVTSIHFVRNRPNSIAEKAWVFDGISCYFNNGAIYLVVGNNLKITGSMNGAFSNLTSLTKIDGFDLIDTSYVVDMSNLFKNCSSLTELDIKDLETDSLVLAKSMFQECSELVELNLSDVNMENVIDMDMIFSCCESLDNLYLPKTRDVMSLSRAFERVGKRSSYEACIHGLLETGECENMSYMFSESRIDDYSLVESFDTGKLKNVEGMFYNCNLYEADLSEWDTSNIQTTKNMFWSNAGLQSCNMDGWDMSSLNNCEGMFYLCTSIREINLGWKNVNNIQNAAYLFKKCYQMRSVDVSCFGGIKLGDARELFSCCERLTTVYGTSILSDVSDEMFEYCSELEGAVKYSEMLIDGDAANIDGYLTKR